MSGFFSGSVAAFGAGVMASVSPCVYPLLPITLGYLTRQATRGGRMAVVLFSAGQGLTLMALGYGAVRVQEALGFTSEMPEVRVGVGSVLLVAALVSWSGALGGIGLSWNNKVNNSPLARASGLTGAFLFGASSALIMSPCTTPILSTVLALISTAESAAQGLTMMALYSLGFSLVFLALGFGLIRATKLPRSGKWLTVVHHAGTAVLALAGLYFLFDGVWAWQAS